MKIAIIYWKTSSVGGIATHLNSLRTAGIKEGDRVDILHSDNWKRKTPTVFPERKWIRGGDTKIWVDGEIPQDDKTARWLEKNYDAVVYGFICPHPTKAYPEPAFLPLYDVNLPKVAFVMDGYWADYEIWAKPLLERLDYVFCPLESYALPLRELGIENLVISPFPFQPRIGRGEDKSEEPLLIWPCQWKNIKGITQFLRVIPDLPEELKVELYSNGIRYYQLRTTEDWNRAIEIDTFDGYNGDGRATFFGNVDLPEITAAYQRAWFTVNLQGMSSKKETYRRGSYNNTEVEALWYGALPILHRSTEGTDLPSEVYVAVDKAEEIPALISEAIESGFALDEKRRELARDFVREKHLASARYKDLRSRL